MNVKCLNWFKRFSFKYPVLKPVLKVILWRIYMLTHPPPPKKRRKQQKREASEMEKIVRKYSQLSWHEALFLGPFWFFKVHILAWNRKQLEEGISCIIYWPEGPFLSYWQVFLTNHLWNKKNFLERFHILWLMIKVPTLGKTAPIPYSRGQPGPQKENPYPKTLKLSDRV